MLNDVAVEAVDATDFLRGMCSIACVGNIVDEPLGEKEDGVCSNSSAWIFYLDEVSENPNNLLVSNVVLAGVVGWRREVEEVLETAVALADDAGLSEKLRGHVVVVDVEVCRLNRKRETIFRLARTSLSHLL